MKKIAYLALTTILLIGCSTPTLKEQIKTVLDNHEKTVVTDVHIDDTVWVKDFDSSLVHLDKALSSINESLEKLPIQLEAAKKRLAEAEVNRKKATYPVIQLGFDEVILGEKRNIASFTELIAKNQELLEKDKLLRKQIDKDLQQANDSIAYIKVRAKVGGKEKKYNLSPELKMLDLD